MTDPTCFGVITDANGVTNASAGDQTGARFALAVISVGQTIAFGGLSASLL